MDNKKKENFARFGIATKGVVYCLVGGLTIATAFSGQGKKTGSSGALTSLADEPFGQILLGIIALGLIGFIFWQFYRAIADPEDKGDDKEGIVKRIAYALSGIFYSALAFTAIKLAIGSGSSSGGGKESAVSTILSKPFGQVLVGILGAIFLGKAIYELYIAYSGKFKEKVQAAELDDKVEKIVLNTGYVGYTARGLVIGVISFLIFKAAFSANSSKAGGTKDAFSFIQNEFGTIVMAVIALGLFAYGIFMIVKARYKTLGI